MKRIHVLGMALVAMFAFAAITASAAFAEFSLAQWLVNGATVSAELPSDTEGELLLENTSNKGAILCSGILVGTIGPESLDVVNELRTLGNVGPIALGGVGLLCEADPGSSCEAGTDIEVWPDNLPWWTEVELELVSGAAFDLAIPNGSGLLPGYEILCLAFLLNVEELCQLANGTASELNNGVASVLVLGAAKPNGNCGSGTENGLIEVENEVLILTTEAGTTLQVSE